MKTGRIGLQDGPLLRGLVVLLGPLGVASFIVDCALIAGIDSPTMRPGMDASEDATNESRPSDGHAPWGEASDGGSATDGTTDAGAGCGPSTCANGCCNGSACVPYSLQVATGGGGLACGTCSGGCCAHVNANTSASGLGQAFFDCQPLCDSMDDGGSGTSCTQQGARDACNAYLASFDGGTCVQECCNSCNSGNQFLYVTPACIPGLTNGCITWAYYVPGADRAGQVWQDPPGQASWCLTSNSGVYWR